MSQKPNWSECRKYILSEVRRFERYVDTFLEWNPGWVVEVGDGYERATKFYIAFSILASARSKNRATSGNEKITLCSMNREEVSLAADFVATLLEGRNLKAWRDPSRQSRFCLEYEVKIKDYHSFI